ncbi:hypothetical protein AMECASPLE_005075 [Ameca splendens]|uniref:Afadin n=1 Tax=Ameca splendens TaxID=208324 RepID=A0ABV0ZVW4_9TELE
MSGSREEERRKLADIINHWNANRLDLFEISQPTEQTISGMEEESFQLLSYSGVATANQHNLHRGFLRRMPFLLQPGIQPGSCIKDADSSCHTTKELDDMWNRIVQKSIKTKKMHKVSNGTICVG